MPYIFLLALLLGIGCQQVAETVSEATMTSNPPVSLIGENSPDTLLTESVAERILGEAAHLTDSAFITSADTLEYRLTYTADMPDAKTGKTGILYFLFTRYARPDIAKAIYKGFHEGNRNSDGFKDLKGIGDEAYFHSDEQNFCFIVAIKNEKMIRMKVNKLTSKTSVAAFNQGAKAMVDRL